MLSDYRWRKLKRDEVRRSYQEMKHEQGLVKFEQVLMEWEEAFHALHRKRPLKSERPKSKNAAIKSTQNMWAQLHNEEISRGLDD